MKKFLAVVGKNSKITVGSIGYFSLHDVGLQFPVNC